MARSGLAACSATALGLAAACASFSSSDTDVVPKDASTEDGSAPDTGVAAPDAASDAAPACAPAGCGTSVGAACIPVGCSDVTFSGDFDAGAVGVCAGSTVHVQTTGTNDMNATIRIATPDTNYDHITISGRLRAPVWATSSSTLRLSVNGNDALILFADPRVNGVETYTICADADAASCTATHQAKVSDAVVFTVSIFKDHIDVDMDCTRVVTLPGVALPTSSSVKMELGGAGEPSLDATLTDVVVAYE